MSEADCKAYLPSLDPKHLNRNFVWGVYGSINKEQALKYYQQTYDLKMQSRLPIVKVRTLDIEPEWVEKLLQYDVQPSKASNKHTTIHLNFSKPANKPKKPPVSKKTLYSDFIDRNPSE
jgi:hypothetical protein